MQRLDKNREKFSAKGRIDLKKLKTREIIAASEQPSWLPSPPIVDKNMCIIYVVVVAADMSENDAEDMSQDDAEDDAESLHVDDDDVDVDVDDDDEEGGEEGGGGEGHAERKI